MTDPLERLVDLVHRRSGILVGHRLPALRAAVGRVGNGASPQQLVEMTADGRTGAALLERLIDEITINETFFMRHRAELDGIPWAALLGRAREQGRRTVRVWSAACASGEEAYSLAILALEALPGVAAPVSVLGTDISGSCLATARAGSYGARSMRHVEPALRERYFCAGPRGSATVEPGLRSHVRLARHNLVLDRFPPAGEAGFDLVVCRNVLMYFDPPTAVTIASRLRGTLADSGVLVLGVTDLLTLNAPASVTSRPSGRPPPAAAPPPPPDARPPLAVALADADAGRYAAALSGVTPMLAADPLNIGALCIQGLAWHARGDPTAALGSLRLAVYLDPEFARAAFELGRVHDALGDPVSARRAYRQALSGLGREVAPDAGLGDFDAGVAAACRARLAVAAGQVGP